MLGEATPEDSPVGLKSLTQPRLSQLEPPPPIGSKEPKGYKLRMVSISWSQCFLRFEASYLHKSHVSSGG